MTHTHARSHTVPLKVGKATKVVRFISTGREVILAATVCPVTLRFIRINKYDWRRASLSLLTSLVRKGERGENMNHELLETKQS